MMAIKRKARSVPILTEESHHIWPIFFRPT
jgi:hypothetical protein